MNAAQTAARNTQSYEMAAYHYRTGIVSEDVWRWYVFFWTWTCGRYGGAAGLRQDRAFKALGSDIYFRRIERVRALWTRLRSEQS